MQNVNVGKIVNQFHQQPIGTIYNPPTNYIPPKPVFVIRVPIQIDAIELQNIRNNVMKDEIKDDYHIIVVPSNVTDFEFEMLNADKIERKTWNELVNKILK